MFEDSFRVSLSKSNQCQASLPDTLKPDLYKHLSPMQQDRFEYSNRVSLSESTDKSVSSYPNKAKPTINH